MTISLPSDDAALPTDLHSAHAEIVLLRAQVDEMDVLRTQLVSRERQVRVLQAKLDELARRVFGKKSEKLDPRQLRLALDLLASAVELSPEGEPIESDSGESLPPSVRNRSRTAAALCPEASRGGKWWWTYPTARSAAPAATTSCASGSR